MSDRRESGLKGRTRLDDALAELRAVVDPVDRTERIPVPGAVGRVLAEDVTASRTIPHYDRAAMDGFAVRAEDTFGASDRSPALLRTGETVGPDRAVAVHTGSPVPEGADAVVRVEETATRGDELEVTSPVATGENVDPTGADVPAGTTVLAEGRRLRDSDLQLCTSVGRTRVEVVVRPAVGVVPTGEELVGADPDPGEVVETNGLTVASFVDRWGGKPTYRNPVTDDYHALRSALQRDLTKDIVVTTGGTAAGERDRLPDVLADLGEVAAHGIALTPGYSAGFGVVQETPILAVPGYPVACLVAAMALARPAIKRAGRLPVTGHPTREARLAEKIRSEVGTRTYARVTVDGPRDGDGAAGSSSENSGPGLIARPVRTGGAGVMSGVAAADGWVVVTESREGIPAGETVPVADWEYSP